MMIYMKTENQKFQNLQTSLPMILAAVCIAIFSFLYIGLNHCDWALMKPFVSDNLVLYISSFVFGALVFIVMRLFFSVIPALWIRKITERQFSGKTASVVTCIICAVIAALLIHRRFIAEFYEYPARDIPYKSFHLLPDYLALFLILTICLLFYFVLQNANNSRNMKILTGASYIFTVLFVFAFLYSPVLDKGSSVDIHHGSAYIQTIYNALYLVPYNLETTGVYGHYGIFYAAIMRIFHLNSEGVFLLVGMAGALTTICGIFVIHSLIKNSYLRITAAVSLAVPQALVYTANYWENYPHRILFPMLLTVWLVLVIKDRKRYSHKWFRIAVAYAISIFAIVWNTETGFYCLVITMTVFIFQGWQKYKWYESRMFLQYLIHIVSSMISVAAAYGIVYMFNIYCCGRKGIPASLSLKEFFFPLGIVDSFIGKGVQADAMFGNHAWIYVLILFLIAMIYAIRCTTWFENKPDLLSPDAPLIAAMALLGIMNLMIYFEHAAYGKLSMCLFPAVICIAYLCERWNFGSLLWKTPVALRKVLKNSFSFLGYLTLTVLAAEVLTMGPVNIGLHGYLNHGKSDIHHLASLYNSVVPPDTFSIGSFVDVLNYQLHQESDAHYRDLSDLYVGGDTVAEKIINDALEHDYFSIWLMGNGEEGLLEKILQIDPNYKLSREIDLGGYPLQVYSRVEEIP